VPGRSDWRDRLGSREDAAGGPQPFTTFAQARIAVPLVASGRVRPLANVRMG